MLQNLLVLNFWKSLWYMTVLIFLFLKDSAKNISEQIRDDDSVKYIYKYKLKICETEKQSC